MKVFLAGLIAAETDGVVTDERRLPGRQGRLLFAYLVAEEGRAVPRDELAEALWGEHPPATWDKALSVLVSKLRGLLAEHGIDGARALTGAFGCYRLELPEGTWIDVVVAAEAAEEAERELASGDLEGAKDAATLAESLVRQPFLPGDDGTWVDEKRRELADIRVRALSVLADACRRSGDAREAARWAEQAIDLEPFRESGYRRLMEAHAAAGDGAEALRVYERCRRLLAEELGAFPSPETESIYRALLEAPPAPTEAGGLDVPTREATAALHPETEARASARRVPPWKPIGAAAAVVAVVAAAAAGLLAIGGGETQAAVAANSAVALNPSGSIAAIVPVGARPVAVAVGSGSIWVANSVDHSVTRVDLSSREAVRAIAIGGAPSALAGGAERYVGHRRRRTCLEDRRDVRPGLFDPEARRLGLGLLRAVRTAADAQPIRVDLDRRSRRLRLPNRSGLRAFTRIRRRRKRPVCDRSRRRLRLGDEPCRRHGHAHRSDDARRDDDPGRPRARRSCRQRGGRVGRERRRRHARANRHRHERRRRHDAGRRCADGRRSRPRPRSGSRGAETARSSASIHAPAT